MAWPLLMPRTGWPSAAATKLFNVINARSDERSAFHRRFANRWLWAAIGLALALQALVVYAGPLQRAFGTVPLSAADWL